MKKKNLSIIYIITKLELGGAQKVCLSLFNELEKKDHITWLISGIDGPLTKNLTSDPHAFLIPCLQRECSFKSIITEIKAFFEIVKILKKIKSLYPQSIVHTHSTKAGYLGRWAAFFARIPYRIHTIHGFGFHEHQSRLTYYIAYLLELFTSIITSHYVCVSQQDQKTGSHLLPGFFKKNSLIRAAIEDKKFVPAQLNKNKKPKNFIFGTVSCFKKQKNLFDLLEAFNLVYKKNKNTRLEIIGDGFLRSDIELWIKNHILNDVITLHGWIEQVVPFMQKWHVFVMSSLWEGLPCAAVEARFLKLPVIAYNVGGISEIIHSGKNGFLYEPKNIINLSAGMLCLSTEITTYQKLKNYNENLKDFTLNTMTYKHQSLYKKILNN